MLKWNTNVAAQPMSFKELQMADQEEMKKIEKQNQIELERKKADARAAAETRNQVTLTGICRFQCLTLAPLDWVGGFAPSRTGGAGVARRCAKNCRQSQRCPAIRQKSVQAIQRQAKGTNAIISDKPAKAWSVGIKLVRD